jgi:ribonuclease P protein component
MRVDSSRKNKTKISYKDAINGGVRYNIKGINVFVKNKTNQKSNLGVIISKKVSNLAVVRNKYRRILKEIFRLDFKLLEYKDLVFIVNKKILDLDFNRIRKELSKVRKHVFNEKINSDCIDNAN